MLSCLSSVAEYYFTSCPLQFHNPVPKGFHNKFTSTTLDRFPIIQFINISPPPPNFKIISFLYSFQLVRALHDKLFKCPTCHIFYSSNNTTIRPAFQFSSETLFHSLTQSLLFELSLALVPFNTFVLHSSFE